MSSVCVVCMYRSSLLESFKNHSQLENNLSSSFIRRAKYVVEGRAMQCPSCGSRDIDFHEAGGHSACVKCGTVVEENVIVSSIEFQVRKRLSDCRGNKDRLRYQLVYDSLTVACLHNI